MNQEKKIITYILQDIISTFTSGNTYYLVRASLYSLMDKTLLLIFFLFFLSPSVIPEKSFILRWLVNDKLDSFANI